MALLSSAEVPEYMLRYSGNDRRVWGSNGHIEFERIPSRVVDVLKDDSRLSVAIRTLKGLALVTSKPGPLRRESYSVNSRLKMHICQSMTDTAWKLQAAQLVLWTFPIDDHLDPIQ